MEAVDTELDRLISWRASQDRRQDPDEREEAWKESVRTYRAAQEAERRAAWSDYHQGQAKRLKRVMMNLVEHHERQAIKLLEGNQQ
ncbi:MAG: hypothetical protein M3518_01310 [Actinomycetota bacterium]|nr:hypothetical protein [Actinomycetota bacterium]